MIAARLPLLAFGALATLVVLTLASALAAANAVSPTGADDLAFPITPNDLLPPECRAVMTVTALVVGGSGGNAPELILGTGGSDNLRGNGGDDCIVGGDGDDELQGGGTGGIDVLLGGAGDDQLRGGNGTDRMYGGPGDDQLIGNNGADYLDGGPGNDQCNGGPGPDTAVACESTTSVP